MPRTEERTPGWDAKQIARIASASYGGYAQMFEKHHWPERGSDMMRKVQLRVKATYGSIDAFVKQHTK
jgi:hypothetical protein